MLLLEAFPTSTPNGCPGLERERPIQAVMLFACAPHLLNPSSPEDAKIIALAKAALPFINHESIQEGERQL